jgi:hypothetical protein
MKELSLLLRLTRFMGLFFASPGVIVDGGTGGGDGEGGEGGGGGTEGEPGDEGGDDGAAEGDEGEDADPDAEEELNEDDNAGEDDEESEEGDGKRHKQEQASRDAVKKALNKLRESDPATAKLLRKEFFDREQTIARHREAFPTASAAIEARDLIESSGGAEGIETNKQQADTFAKELMQMANGDPEIVAELARDYPEGLIKMAPAAMDHWRDIDIEGFESYTGGLIAQTLDQKHVTQGFARVSELIADGKQQAAFDKMNEIRKWFDGIRTSAKEHTTRQNDPRDAAIKQREEAAAKTERGIFTEKAATATVGRTNSSIQKKLAPYLRDAIRRKAPLSIEQKRGVVEGIYTRISRTLSKDQRYQARMKELMSGSDVAKVERFVGNEVDKLVKKATRAEWHSRGFATGAGAKKKIAAGPGKGAGAGAGGAAGAGAAKGYTFGTKPAAHMIDWTKDKSRMRFTSGEATLLPKYGGKVVKWSWDKV